LEGGNDNDSNNNNNNNNNKTKKNNKNKNNVYKSNHNHLINIKYILPSFSIGLEGGRTTVNVVGTSPASFLPLVELMLLQMKNLAIFI
jgi:hypothetical protein